MHLYGLSVPALGPGADVSRCTCDWWPLDFAQRAGAAPVASGMSLDDERGTLRARDLAQIDVFRRPLSAIVSAPVPLAEDVLAHPILAFVGAVCARWGTRSAFHAASVLLRGRAWVLLGEPGGGKTTLTSVLHASGAIVMADDLTVIDGHTVLAGPRSGDLRPSAAAHLGRGAAVHSRVGRERWRENFGHAPLEAPLAGFLTLAWGADLRIEPLSIAERLATLGRHEAFVMGPSAHRGFLDLIHLPMHRLTRPENFSQLESTAELVRQVAIAAS